MNVFERYLAVWVFLCILVGIAVGQILPTQIHFIGSLSIAQVNLPVGVLIEVPVMLLVVRIVNQSKGCTNVGAPITRPSP